MSESVEDRKARVRACMRAVQEALDDHGCAIVATLETEEVGTMRDRALVQARWGVVPRKAEEEAEPG